MEETIGKRIARHRKSLGLTQDQLAEQLGVTAQAVSKWENDQSCPDIAMLPKLSRIFGITADQLLGSTPETEAVVGEIVEENEKDGIHLEKNGWEFHYDSGRKESLRFALLVLAVGAQLLLARLLPARINFWQILWPTALVVLMGGGIFRHFSFVKLVSILLGGWFLLDYWELVPNQVLQIGDQLVFPLLVLVFGASLLIDALKKPGKPSFRFQHNSAKKKNDFHTDAETFTYNASFGESTQRPNMARLRHGEISCAFGEYEVDLTQVAELAEHCTLEMNCAFGELTLRLPRRFAIRQKNSTFLGGFDISGHPDPNPQGVIDLDASASFGEISVEYI